MKWRQTNEATSGRETQLIFWMVGERFVSRQIKHATSYSPSGHGVVHLHHCHTQKECVSDYVYVCSLYINIALCYYTGSSHASTIFHILNCPNHFFFLQLSIVYSIWLVVWKMHYQLHSHHLSYFISLYFSAATCTSHQTLQGKLRVLHFSCWEKKKKRKMAVNTCESIHYTFL